eukprot:c8880_g1_i1 orf=43-648(-)
MADIENRVKGELPKIVQPPEIAVHKDSWKQFSVKNLNGKDNYLQEGSLDSFPAMPPFTFFQDGPLLLSQLAVENRFLKQENGRIKKVVEQCNVYMHVNTSTGKKPSKEIKMVIAAVIQANPLLLVGSLTTKKLNVCRTRKMHIETRLQYINHLCLPTLGMEVQEMDCNWKEVLSNTMTALEGWRMSHIREQIVNISALKLS